MAEYDSIAEAYRDSKRLPFRECIERHTLFKTLGNIQGKTALDLACGDGFYTRLIRQAGAAETIGIDISPEMIRLAEQEEKRQPLGCRYVCQDVAKIKPSTPVDVVVAMYLLNYADTAERLRCFCRVGYNALRPGGRFLGVNDNVLNPPQGTLLWKKYGFEKTCSHPAKEGDVILYTVTNQDGRSFQFQNYYLKPETYQEAFCAAGFQHFRWVPLCLHPSQQNNPFWDDFMASPPIIGFEAQKPTA